MECSKCVAANVKNVRLWYSFSPYRAVKSIMRAYALYVQEK